MIIKSSETQSLGEICDQVKGIIRTGPFGSQLHQEDYSEDGIPVVMPKNIIDGHISISDIARVSEEHIERLSQHKLFEGDIIYGRRGDIGRRALITKKEQGWLCGTGCIRISLGNKKVDPVFLYYYLGQPLIIDWIYNQAIGATMPNLNTSIIRSIHITYPPLPVQHKISSILSAFDDLIENNNRRIKILEEMAQTIYREWFVNFRFPGYENVMMVKSELGMIPEGWEVVALGDVVEIRKGINITKKTIKEGFVPVVAGGLTAAYYHDQANTRFPVIAVSASGANAGFVNLYQEDIWASDCSFIDAEATPFVYYFYLLLKHRQIEVSRLQRGAAQPHVYTKDLMRLEVNSVPAEVLERFGKAIVPLFSLKGILAMKNTNLRKTRDLLLPRLISGAIDVDGMDIDIEEVKL
ncbi:restriction endonuclease subunit S [candidate division WS5 bacterium]|uniref:Restriction endonuclease subunit S n=1 Tax=candidate division WS5 bacterium TaxID=2093353 RepID=A0A419DE31_9BACT|nr:MAG: restriction endonuclease subunit S [candidate division WS5 bacterium]